MNVKRRVGGFSVVLMMLIGCFVVSDVMVSGVIPSYTSRAAAAGAPVQPLVSARLADTRNEPTSDGQHTNIGRRPAGTFTPIKITGRGGVPADASAVIINLTSVQPAAYTYLTAYPCGTSRPDASTVNSPPRIDRANSALVKLATDGTICVYNEAEGDFIIDINGYVPANGSPTAVVPARLLDTRPGRSTIDGNYLGAGRATPQSITKVQITGRGGVPNNATAAIFTLTAELPQAHTYLTAYPCDGSKPTDTSNLNVPPGDTRANNVFVKLDTGGAVCIYTEAATDIIIDISGYVTAGGSPTGINPIRLADSRTGEHTIDGQYLGFGQRTAMSETPIQIAGRGGIPNNATAALINLTADKTIAGTYLTAYPCGTARPEPGSNLNLPQGDTAANSIYVRLNPKGQVCIYTVAPTDIIIDINGYTTTPVTTPVTTPATTTAPVVTTCSISGTAVRTEIPQAECDALIAIYNGTGGSKWKDRTNWMTKSDPCTWAGVSCDESHVDSLFLYQNGLVGPLPPQIGSLTSLVLLDLGSNAISTLPAEIGKLTSLARLNLSRNPGIKVPTALAKLGNLRDLDISHDQFKSLPTEIFSLSNLTDLDAGNNQLASIPVGIGKLVNLTSLSLNSNALTTLPTELGSLTKLTYLNLSSNSLNQLPDPLFKLTGLTTLFIAANGLTVLPNRINVFTKLTELSIGFNPLKKYPTQINGFKNLTYLDLREAQLATLDASIGSLVKLTELRLSGNQLSSLPSQFSNLNKITILWLDSNQFKTFPTQLNSLTELRTLVFGENQLTSLPTTLSNFRQLRWLKLTNNKLSGDITAVFKPIMVANSSTIVYLSGNQCLRTTDTELAAWLTKTDAAWKNPGCP